LRLVVCGEQANQYIGINGDHGVYARFRDG
jgi:hypothetical protein